MRREVFRHKWITLWESDEGSPFMMMDPSDGWGTMIVPVNNSGDVLIQSEFSIAYNEQVWFLPGGSIEVGEDPAESANRELQEEAGYKAGRLDFLGEVYPFQKYLRAHVRVYIGRDLTPSKLQGDDGWEITVEPVRLSDLESLIATGKLRDSSVIAALYMARAFLQGEQSKGARA